MIKSFTESLYTIDGTQVTFTENAEVYNLAGRKVATCVAGEATELPAGFYVARTATGAPAKFVVR